MLVLTRRDGESFFIGDTDIQVRILGVKGNQVRIGIQAPKDMPVFREEVKHMFLGERCDEIADAAA